MSSMLEASSLLWRPLWCMETENTEHDATCMMLFAIINVIFEAAQYAALGPELEAPALITVHVLSQSGNAFLSTWT